VRKKYFYGAKLWGGRAARRISFLLSRSIVRKILEECNELENDVKMLTKLLNETLLTDVMELKKAKADETKKYMIDHEYPSAKSTEIFLLLLLDNIFGC